MNAAPCLYSYYVAYVTHTSMCYNSFVNTLHFNLFAIKVQMLLMFPGEVTLRVQLFSELSFHVTTHLHPLQPHIAHTPTDNSMSCRTWTESSHAFSAFSSTDLDPFQLQEPSWHLLLFTSADSWVPFMSLKLNIWFLTQGPNWDSVLF